MSSDPRILTVVFEDLLYDLALWSTAARETLATAYQTQRQSREDAARALHHAAVVLDEAQADQAAVNQLLADSTSLVHQSENGKVEAHNTLNEARRELQNANATLEFWEEELRKALAWLERAEARLARALDEYERARNAFEQAKWNAERAESKYRACMNDRNRSNCNSEARALNAAQEELQRAIYRLQVAEAEVIAAREEVAAAKARVECCSNAVHYATEAVNVALESVADAEQAVNAVERALEFAQAAEQNALAAQEKITTELTAAEEMLAASREAVSMTETAGQRLADADRSEESAQRHATGSRHELEYRLRMLHQFDLPDLYSATSIQAVACAAGAPGKTWIDRGISFISVSDLPNPEGIVGQRDFKKITEAEMRSGLAKLQEMKSLIESGAGASSDYWANYDREHKLDFSEGYQRVFDAFYGNDCIKVNKDQNAYDIDNGRHRIWLAKQMGIEELPMRVVERNKNA